MTSATLSTRIGSEGTVAWSPGMSIGDGFDAHHMQPSRSPFLPVKHDDAIEPLNGQSLEIEYQTYANTKDVAKAYDLCTRNIVSREELMDSAAVRFLKSARIDSTNVATIIRCTVTSPPQVPDTALFTLTTEAADYLTKHGATDFQTRYGTHFVAGHVSHADFYIMMQHRVHDLDVLPQLRQLLEKRLTALFNQSEKAKESPGPLSPVIDTQVGFAFTGSGHTVSKAFYTLDDVVPFFEGWKSKLRPQPHVAVLKHYRLVINGIHRPISKWKVFDDVFEAHRQLTLSEIEARVALADKELVSSHSSRSKMIESLREGLMKIDVSDDDWRENLTSWEAQFGQCRTDIDQQLRLVDLRQGLLIAVRNSQKTEPWPLNKKFFPGKITEFHTGITDPLTLRPLGSEVELFMWDFSKQNDNSIVQKETLRFGNAGDRLIVGILATSDREPDPHNNGWFRLMKGGVGQSFVEMLFETSHWRAGEWSVEIWHVNKTLYCG